MKFFVGLAYASSALAQDFQLFGLGLPFQSLSRVADTFGLGASGFLRGMHQQMLDMTAPFDEARVQAINSRDAGLQDHLQFMESAYNPVQNLATVTGSGLNRLTNGFDQVASTLLRPVTDTASFLGRVEQAALDRGTNTLNLGLISPAVLILPALCPGSQYSKLLESRISNNTSVPGKFLRSIIQDVEHEGFKGRYVHGLKPIDKKTLENRTANYRSELIDELSRNTDPSFNTARAVSGLFSLDRNVWAVPVPNGGINRLERTLTRTGNDTQQAVLGFQEAVHQSGLPFEDARTMALTARDIGISNRISRREPIVRAAFERGSELNGRLDDAVDNLDELAGRTILRPLSQPLSLVGRTQRRILDMPAHASLIVACWGNPECCLTPELCTATS